VYNFISGVNFCGENFGENFIFVACVQLPQKLEPAKKLVYAVSLIVMFVLDFIRDAPLPAVNYLVSHSVTKISR